MRLSQAIEGYTLHAKARRLSQHTIDDYSVTFRKLLEHLGDVDIASVTSADIEAFMAAQDSVSKKTLANYVVGCGALWTWAVDEGLAPDHIIRSVKKPKPEQREVIPYTQADVKAMLRAVGQSKEYDRPGKETTVHSLPMANRNKAILLLLLDTGIRASELCDLRFDDVDLANGRITVMGKGSKERTLYIADRTRSALWRYSTERPERAGDTFFTTARGGPISRHSLYKMIEAVADKAGVKNATIHRFRHTFAIQFLRNGGNVFMLQRSLGHSSLEMSRRYLALSEVDFEEAQRRSSPVDGWFL